MKQQDSLYDNVSRTQQSLKDRMFKWIETRNKTLSGIAYLATASFVTQLARIFDSVK